MKIRRIIKNIFRGRQHFYNVDGSIRIESTQYKFADAIYLGVLKKILEGLQNTEYFLNEDDERNAEKRRLFNSFVGVFQNNIEKVLIRLIENGEVFFELSDGFFFLVDERNKNKATHKIESTAFKLQGISDKMILKEDFQHIDNILNAVSTSVKRLGALVLLTPSNDATIPIFMNDEEIREFEADLSRDYGTLEAQSPVKIMRRKFDVNQISLAGATLRTNENLQTAVKIVCDVLEVPYELVSSAIVGNPNQTGVYQKEAVKRLYSTVEKYAQIFVRFAKEHFNLDVDYTILTAPQDEIKEEWEGNKLVVETLSKSIQEGFITRDEASEMFKVHFNL